MHHRHLALFHKDKNTWCLLTVNADFLVSFLFSFPRREAWKHSTAVQRGTCLLHFSQNTDTWFAPTCYLLQKKKKKKKSDSWPCTSQRV